MGGQRGRTLQQQQQLPALYEGISSVRPDSGNAAQQPLGLSRGGGSDTPLAGPSDWDPTYSYAPLQNRGFEILARLLQIGGFSTDDMILMH